MFLGYSRHRIGPYLSLCLPWRFTCTRSSRIHRQFLSLNTYQDVVHLSIPSWYVLHGTQNHLQALLSHFLVSKYTLANWPISTVDIPDHVAGLSERSITLFRVAKKFFIPLNIQIWVTLLICKLSYITYLSLHSNPIRKRMTIYESNVAYRVSYHSISILTANLSTNPSTFLRRMQVAIEATYQNGWWASVR